MELLHYGETTGKPTIAMLFPKSHTLSNTLQQLYVAPLTDRIPDWEVTVGVLPELDKAEIIHKYMEKVVPALTNVGIKCIATTRVKWFKSLTGLTKTANCWGTLYDCKYGDVKVALMPNGITASLGILGKSHMSLSLEAIKAQYLGTYLPKGMGLEANRRILTTPEEIKEGLNSLLNKPMLTVDIEAWSLKHYKAGIGTITFCDSQNSGIVFACDHYDSSPYHKRKGVYVPNPEIQDMLKEFFDEYKGTTIYHGIGYDVKVLTYVLYMDHLEDWEGMHTGLEVLTRNCHCTNLIAYLALNNAELNVLNLKALCLPFLGDYGIDVKDIGKVHIRDLLDYNYLDGLGTWYTFNEYFPKMVEDDQLGVYEHMRLNIRLLLQMALTGIPLHDANIESTDKELQSVLNTSTEVLNINRYITEYLPIKRQKVCNARNAKLKVKVIPLCEFDDVMFNPNSAADIGSILFDVIKLPVLHTTDTGAPSTDSKTLSKLGGFLKAYQSSPVFEDNKANPLYRIATRLDVQAVLDLLDNLDTVSKVTKLLSTYITAMNEAPSYNGRRRLYGNYNQDRVVSGRMSSSDVNLQNQPNKGKYGKLMRSCYAAPDGRIMGSADADSLEDKVASLVSKDSMKLKVYTDLYDGHCLRTFYYEDHLPLIQDKMDLLPLYNSGFKHCRRQDAKGNTYSVYSHESICGDGTWEDVTPTQFEVGVINSIDYFYPDERQDSKVPTFALTYLGTEYTLQMQCGFTKAKATRIETAFHAMYVESDVYMEKRLMKCVQDGYVTLAFGLRLRAPNLHNSNYGFGYVSQDISQERRTIGNALYQSYCQLTVRAARAVADRLRNSKYRNTIMIVGSIHDDNVFELDNCPDQIKFLNDILIQETAWQELDELKHPTVKLSSSMEVHIGNWSNKLGIPNESSRDDITEILNRVTE